MRKRSPWPALGAFAIATTLLPFAVNAAPADDVTTAFNAFVTAQNAHDINAVKATLWDSPSFLWITRGTPVLGR
ncbi:MAG TPA: hypothetical protein VGM99_03505, partial [Candidatus Cybelea sp.]